MKFGSITTGIVSDGLVFNMDAANRASYTFYTANSSSYNTVDPTQVGTLTNGIAFLSPPLSSSCWEFDGVNDYVDCGTAIPTELGASCTGVSVSAWIKQSDASTQGNIFNLCSPAGTYGTMALWSNTSGKLQLHLNGNYPRIEYTFSSTDWHHIVGVYDGTLAVANRLKLYVDGVSVGSLNDNSGGSPSPTSFDFPSVSPKTTRIGWGWSNSYTFYGLISNTHIYNRGLSANEVLHNYNALKGRFA